jgi:hypothetical protein
LEGRSATQLSPPIQLANGNVTMATRLVVRADHNTTPAIEQMLEEDERIEGRA